MCERDDGVEMYKAETVRFLWLATKFLTRIDRLVDERQVDGGIADQDEGLPDLRAQLHQRRRLEAEMDILLDRAAADGRGLEPLEERDTRSRCSFAEVGGRMATGTWPVSRSL